jgi:hypothetical protein
MGLPINWLSHLPKDSEERTKLEATIRASSVALGRLQDILLKILENHENASEDFTIPAWAEKQAYTLGQIKAYRNVLQLLSFMDQK